jgi:membrane protein DedA with SNARE-associated domain
VSPSKKANKQKVTRQTESAQKKTKKSAVRSSRVEAKRTALESRKIEPAVASLTALPTVINTPKKNIFWVNALRILALFAVVGITLYVFSIRNRVEEFAALGYPGIFLIALLANATVLLPAPGVAVIYAMGAIFNPFGVGLAAGTGGAIGELSGYLAGFSGQAVIERTEMYNRIKPWVEKYGGWAILILSAIPNPFFDVAGIAAGIAKMPIGTFLFFIWIGQLIKMTLFALAGKYSIEWIINLIN